MTREERDLRVKALDIIVLVTQNPEHAEKHLADMLRGWFTDIENRAAKTCLNVANEWRRNDLSIQVGEHGSALRKQAAESAELCARRIAKDFVNQVVPSPSEGEKK